VSNTNTLTMGGGAAGTVTAVQLANDLANLSMFGLSCLDGHPGFDVDLAVVEAGTRVAAVLWSVVITIAGAAIGYGVARLMQRWGAAAGAPVPPAPPQPSATV